MPAKEFDAFTRLDASDVNAYLANKSISNALINGAFDIWQRGTSFSSPASGAYTADRFTHTFDGTGATRTITRELFSPGSAPATSEIGTFHYRYAQTVAGSGGTFLNVLQQYVENVRTFSGQTVTYSIWAKAATAGNYFMGIGQNFGDSGSAFTGAGNKTIAVTTSWQRFDLTVAMPSISGKTVGTNNKLEVYVQATPNTTFTLDIWGVQLEPGTVANDFRRNANSIQGELAACQRYYYQWVNSAVDAQFGPTSRASTTFSSKTFFLPVTMRTTPTVVSTASGGVFFRTVEYNTSFNITTGSINAVSVGTSFNSQSIDLNFERSAGLDGSYVYQTLDTAGVGSSVAFSAEL
jgi:hypothetical protein